MPLTRIIIENYKSIKRCDLSVAELNLLIGENGSGKTNILDAICYFYENLTTVSKRTDIFDENNKYSNCVRIALYFDFSNFVRISKSNSDTLPELFIESKSKTVKYSGYYKRIISMASNAKRKTLVVELRQIKNKEIVWNYDYEDRLILKSLFPLFSVDTRTLDVLKWDYIWAVIGELSKVSNIERKGIEKKISEILNDERHEVAKKIRSIENIFAAANLDIPRATSKEFAQNLSKIYFSGEEFESSGKKLSYYSTGTNSVSYINLLLKTIEQVALTKMKEPIVLLDEPEISLHPLFIDELTETILSNSHKLCILVSTHSSRTIKNIIKGSDNSCLYNVRLVNKYSSVQKMKLFSQYSPVSKYRVTDDHVNAYFSRAIVFVEGETELELFSNPYLRAMFPTLKYVDVYKALSEEPVLNIMHPNRVKTQTQFVSVIDMDKAIGYKSNTNELYLKLEYFSDKKEEQYLFYNKHDKKPSLSTQRKRIRAMTDKLRIHYYKPYFSTNDLNYSAYVEAIKEYLLNYNVYVFATTVEGALINKKSLDIASEFLKENLNTSAYESFTVYLNGLHATDRLNAMRIVFNGKTDLLLRYGGKNGIRNSIVENERLIIEAAMIGKKTSGWVSGFLSMFFLRETSSTSLKAFEAHIKDRKVREAVEKTFLLNFPELFILIQKICGML